jgi:type I restriction enzyme S subunit
MSTTTQHTQTAYKDTSIGKIPADWEVTDINSLGEVYSGGTPDTNNDSYWNGKINWCTPTDITKLDGSKYIGETIAKITEEGLKNSSAKLLPIGSLIVCTRATIGKAAISTVEITTNQGFKNIVPDQKKANVEYLYYLITNSENRLLKLGNGSTFLEISKNDFEKFKIPLPPLSEQKRIAEVLSTWDQAIQLTEQLIRQKEQRKKWLMQNLLTGKMRLKGFSGEWKECKLGSLGDTYTGLTGKSKEDFGKGKPYIPYLNVFNNSRIDIKNLDYVKITEDDKQNKVKYGDIFFTVSSETPNEVGMASVILDEVDELYLNSFCFGFRLFDFNTLIPEFSSYLLRADTFRAKIYKLSQGATRFNLSKNNLMKLSIILPSKEEQTAIAEVLQAADKEISLLKAKAEKLREQKKGLMQQLLTGRVRLNLITINK